MKNEWHTKSPTKSIENANFQNTFTSPFAIPESWVWVRLGEVCEVASGYTPQNNQLAQKGDIPYFKVSDMNLIENQKYMQVTQLFAKNNDARFFPKNSIIFPKNGGAVFTNKKRILVKNSIVDLNTAVLVPTSLISLEYAFYLVLSIDLGKFTKGSALPTIDTPLFTNLHIPLPPLQEQKYISQTLDNLFTIAKGLRVE